MSSQLLLVLTMRWIHIAAAMLAIGAPFFIRFALLPAASRVLDDAKHQELKAAINARWKHIVYLLITLFLVTGLVNFLVPIHAPDGQLLSARWKNFSPEDRRLYHMLFGFKTLAAIGIFILASALTGRTNLFAPIRKNAKLFLTILLLLAAILLACSSMMRYLPRNTFHFPDNPERILPR
jgi:hypothetical protein